MFVLNYFIILKQTNKLQKCLLTFMTVISEPEVKYSWESPGQLAMQDRTGGHALGACGLSLLQE